MWSKNYNTIELGTKAQELLMRDVLGGMEEFVTLFGYRAQPCEVEIIPVENNAAGSGADQDSPSQNGQAPTRHSRESAEIISYQDKKEELALKLSA